MLVVGTCILWPPECEHIMTGSEIQRRDIISCISLAERQWNRNCPYSQLVEREAFLLPQGRCKLGCLRARVELTKEEGPKDRSVCYCDRLTGQLAHDERMPSRLAE